MLRTLRDSKIHRATVTGAELNYLSSIFRFVGGDSRIAWDPLRVCSS